MRVLATIVATAGLVASCNNARQPRNANQEGNGAAVSANSPEAASPAANRPLPAPESGSTPPQPAPTNTAGRAPSYDSVAYCTQVGNAVGGSYVIERTCREQEGTALAQIRRLDMPDRVFNYCDQVANAVGGSYVIFKTCVEQELGAAAELN